MLTWPYAAICSSLQFSSQITHKAWKDYLRGHIVSAHSRRIIGNFIASTCCYSSQTPDSQEPEVDSKSLEKMPALSISLSDLHGSLRQMTKALGLDGAGAAGQIRKDIQSGCILRLRLKRSHHRVWDASYRQRGHRVWDATYRLGTTRQRTVVTFGLGGRSRQGVGSRVCVPCKR